jgi:hypothetical protein
MRKSSHSPYAKQKGFLEVKEQNTSGWVYGLEISLPFNKEHFKLITMLEKCQIGLTASNTSTSQILHA